MPAKVAHTSWRKHQRAAWLGRLVGLALLIGLPAHAGMDDSAETVRIGVLAFRGAETTVSEWSPMLDRLSRSRADRRFELLRLDHDGLRSAVADRRVDFVITNPGHYVELEAEFGISRILTLAGSSTVSPDQAIGSAVVVRRG